MRDAIKVLKGLNTVANVIIKGNGYLIIKPRLDLQFYSAGELFQQFESDIKVLYSNVYKQVYSIADKDFVIIEFRHFNTTIYEIKLREISLKDRICIGV